MRLKLEDKCVARGLIEDTRKILRERYKGGSRNEAVRGSYILAVNDWSDILLTFSYY